MSPISSSCWKFGIDRGGTFIYIKVKCPDGHLVIHKLLSKNRERYTDAAMKEIWEHLRIPVNEKIPANHRDEDGNDCGGEAG